MNERDLRQRKKAGRKESYREGRKEKSEKREKGGTEGGEGKMEVGKGEKRKGLLRLKRTSPCPRSEETGVIPVLCKPMLCPLLSISSFHVHTWVVFTQNECNSHSQPSLLIAERGSHTTVHFTLLTSVIFATRRNMQLLSTSEAFSPTHPKHTSVSPAAWLTIRNPSVRNTKC